MTTSANMPSSEAAARPAAAGHAATVSVRVWDLPTRLFHWVLALTIVGSIVTGSIGGAAMTWHFRLGFLVLGLLVFRLLWGLFGGRWSRFGSFLYSPAALLRYVRGTPRPGEHLDVGHSPLGAASVFAMLAILAVQVGTGLVADDEIANVGPLNRYVATDTGLAATAWHKNYGEAIIIALVVLHVVAILFYRLRRKTDLIGPMVSGDKALPAARATTVPASRDDTRTRGVALVLAALAAALVVWVMRLGG